jgi:hypothetical protein
MLLLRSFIAVVTGDAIRQDPRWLSGLPEFINWDVDAMVWLPSPKAGTLELPKGTILGLHSGNLHGVSQTQQWDGNRWQSAKEPSATALSAQCGETSASLGLPGAVPLSCTTTNDGTLWVVAEATDTHQSSLRQLEAGGVWKTVDVPPDASVRNVWASGTRLWVAADRKEHQPGEGEVTRFELYSNVPVAHSIDIGRLQIPLWDTGGATPGISTDSLDVPSVSVTPAGPGTPACSSLVVYLGRTASPELLAALASAPAPSAHTILHVTGTAPGTVVSTLAGGRSVSRVRPSGRASSAVALVPASFNEGMHLVQMIESIVPDVSPRLLCAVPYVTRKELLTTGPR